MKRKVRDKSIESTIHHESLWPAKRHMPDGKKAVSINAAADTAKAVKQDGAEGPAGKEYGAKQDKNRLQFGQGGAAPPSRDAPALPWMRMPMAIEGGADTPLTEVCGLQSCLQRGLINGGAHRFSACPASAEVVILQFISSAGRALSCCVLRHLAI
jgi:hypothetical protein